jgi:DeoR/GlpR family transcriptional regulator of sugar metabolism
MHDTDGRDMQQPPQFLAERRHLILQRLHEQRRVSVNELSEWLDVSPVTIRGDLKALQDEGRLQRTHGGAILPTHKSAAPDLSFDIRNRTNPAEKEAIARAAAELVRDGDSIALDASTTCFRMLPYLKKHSQLVILTNSLMIAQHCLDAPQIEVYLPGGRFHRDSVSLVGKPDSLPSINLKLGFFSANGISAGAGITEYAQEMVDIKRAMLGKCLNNYFLADHSKWGKVAPYTLYPSTRPFHMLTTPRAPRDEVDYFESQGATFVFVTQ